VALALAGCGSALTLLKWAAAASTIKSLLDEINPDEPTWTLSGFVYIDQTAHKVVVRATGTLPGGGNYEVYPNAPCSLDTSPPKTTRTDATGFFRFTGIPQAETVHILTIETPDGGRVQFTVRLDTPSIEPLPGS
jgi:hypothetical protein